MTAERLGVNSLRRPGPSRGCSAAAIREMAYIENIEMGRTVALRAGNCFVPELFPACPIWERDPSAAGGGELAVASRRGVLASSEALLR
jgi:hypothetical protein